MLEEAIISISQTWGAIGLLALLIYYILKNHLSKLTDHILGKLDNIEDKILDLSERVSKLEAIINQSLKK